MEHLDIQDNPEIPAVLIILYRRFKNLQSITEVVANAKIPRIYLAVDVPPEHLQSTDYFFERNESLQNLRQFCRAKKMELYIWIRRENLGCARSVLTACQWFYSNEEFGVVLEDDCIPTPDFFEFISQNRATFENNDQINFICGTQHANVVKSSNSISFLLTSYAFLWGWATSRKKWKNIADVFLHPRDYDLHSIKNISETFYWRTGIRRALQRRADVWDTVIVGVMALNGLYAILPPRNLVLNQGLDEFATNHFANHTKDQWNISISTNNPWQELEQVDSSIRRNFFKINGTMLLRNSVRFALDFVTPKKRGSLSEILVSDFQDIPQAYKES